MTDNERVQDLTINALNVFTNYCEKHKLRYYFTGGALIGVLRHKGFIPWDDDLDIFMTPEEYTKLKDYYFEYRDNDNSKRTYEYIISKGY